MSRLAARTDEFLGDQNLRTLRYLKLSGCSFSDSLITPTTLPNLVALEVDQLEGGCLETVRKLLAHQNLTSFKLQQNSSTPTALVKEITSLISTSLSPRIQRSLVIRLNHRPNHLARAITSTLGSLHKTMQPSVLRIEYAPSSTSVVLEAFSDLPPSVERLSIGNQKHTSSKGTSDLTLEVYYLLTHLSHGNLPNLKVLEWPFCERAELRLQVKLTAECKRREIQLFCRDGSL
ncbi:hypothetical protein P7C70_g2370, partial [Phenoliferia sp. Uapishka_3]